MRNKRYLFYILFLISIIMLVIPLIPHHHHANGVICMKHDVKETQCPAHHHHQEDDSCCDGECLTRFNSPTPTVQADFGPQYVFISVLFTDFIIESLLRPLERQLAEKYVYRESLHGTNITRAFALRGPPYTFLNRLT